MKCGDIEQSPGPQPKSCQSFPICCWNLNSISAHNFLKWSLLKAYIAMQKFDVTCICLSETYLNANISNDDAVWKFPVIIYFEQTIHPILNEKIFP